MASPTLVLAWGTTSGSEGFLVFSKVHHTPYPRASPLTEDTVGTHPNSLASVSPSVLEGVGLSGLGVRLTRIPRPLAHSGQLRYRRNPLTVLSLAFNRFFQPPLEYPMRAACGYAFPHPCAQTTYTLRNRSDSFMIASDQLVWVPIAFSQ